jgi:prevent-host-death family protein
MNWNISDAKNRLSEVLTLADDEAQTIVRRDRDYVVMAGDEYRKLTGQEQSFTDFLIDAGPRFDKVKPMKREAPGMRDPQL